MGLECRKYRNLGLDTQPFPDQLFKENKTENPFNLQRFKILSNDSLKIA